MFECCGARGACQGRDWGHDQDNGRQAREARTLELHFLCQSLISIYPDLLWRKIRFKHLLLLLYFVSHSFYLSIKFILLVNIKSFMESHYRLAMVCPPPMTVSGPGPALLWTNNSASLLEDAQGGSHSWEVLSRTIKLDILLTWELEYFLEMNIWDFVTFWGLLFDIELVKLTGGDNSHLNILFLGNPSAIQPKVNLI